MKKQYELFILGMIEHGDPVKAYQSAYPGTADESARTAANRLKRKHPEIAARISAARTRLYSEALTEAETKGKQRIGRELADVQRKRELLACMIDGSFTVKKNIKFKDRVETVEDALSPFAVLRAIELDCKLETGYDWSGRKHLRALKALEKEQPVEDVTEQFDETLIMIGDQPFEGDWGCFFRFERWLQEKPERLTPARRDYRATYTLPDTIENYFRENPWEDLARQKRPLGWTDEMKAKKAREKEAAGILPAPAPLPPAADLPTAQPLPAGNHPLEPEQNGTLLTTTAEQQQLTDREQVMARVQKAIETGHVTPDTDRWELFIALDPNYARRWKSMGMLEDKERFFRGLPRNIQWHWIEPKLTALHLQPLIKKAG